MTHKYGELDGLRGVAAICVVLLHTRFLFFPAAPELLERHSYLAVDFFLLLSGFVIAHAYERRLTSPSARGGFVRDRIIRLYPLLVLGAILGAITIALRPDGVTITPLRQLVFAIAGAIPLPLPGFPWAFPANFPSWSLFWEIVLNGVFAFVVPYLTTRRLVGLVFVSVVATLLVGATHHDFAAGHRFTGLFAAAPRVTTAFFLGVLLLRIHRHGFLANGGRRWWIAPTLIACFYLMGKADYGSFVYDMMITLIAFPVLLLAGAGSKPLLPRLAKFSGEVSYPLYILHIPLLAVLIAATGAAGLPPGVPLASAVVMVLVFVAYAAFRLYDEPVRARLRARYGSKQHRVTPDLAATPAAERSRKQEPGDPVAE